MYIFFEKPNPRDFFYIDGFGLLNFWDILLCSYHSKFYKIEKKVCIMIARLYVLIAPYN